MKLSRRQFCSVALTAPVLAGQSGRPLIDRGFARVTKLADGVYVTIANSEKGPQCVSNGGVIVGRDGILLVEGHFQPAGAALEVAAARLVSKAPIIAAVNTHYHLDHSFGNQAYAERNIPIMAHPRAPGLMKERYAALQGVDKGPLLAPVQRRIEEAADPLEKKHLQSDLGADKWMYRAIDATTLAYPTRFVDSEQRIDLGGITAVIESHPGHTPTDLIVRIPDRDIVFTGDLLFYRAYPVAFDADMIAWRKALAMFLEYGPAVRFIPGHGEVCGLEVVRQHIDVMEDLHAHADKMKAAGVTLEEAERRYTIPARFREFDVWPWSWCVGAPIEKYY